MTVTLSDLDGGPMVSKLETPKKVKYTGIHEERGAFGNAGK